MMRKHGFIRNYDSIKVNTIGRDEGMVKRYIEIIVESFRMNNKQKKYFLAKANPNPVHIQVLLELRAQESLLSTVRAEQLQLVHPWECPNVSIRALGHMMKNFS